MPPIYKEVSISELVPGPRRVSFIGRVFNMYDQGVRSKMPRAAQGCLKLLIKDEHTMVLVRSEIPRRIERITPCTPSKILWRRTKMMLVYPALQCNDLAQIKLWYVEPHDFRLGSLLTVSTTHISSNSPTSTATKPATIPASISSSIFPQRDSGCQIEERCSELSRTLIWYPHGQPLVD